MKQATKKSPSPDCRTLLFSNLSYLWSLLIFIDLYISLLPFVKGLNLLNPFEPDVKHQKNPAASQRGYFAMAPNAALGPSLGRCRPGKAWRAMAGGDRCRWRVSVSRPECYLAVCAQVTSGNYLKLTIVNINIHNICRSWLQVQFRKFHKTRTAAGPSRCQSRMDI